MNENFDPLSAEDRRELNDYLRRRNEARSQAGWLGRARAWEVRRPQLTDGPVEGWFSKALRKLTGWR